MNRGKCMYTNVCWPIVSETCIGEPSSNTCKDNDLIASLKSYISEKNMWLLDNTP